MDPRNSDIFLSRDRARREGTVFERAGGCEPRYFAARDKCLRLPMQGERLSLPEVGPMGIHGKVNDVPRRNSRQGTLWIASAQCDAGATRGLKLFSKC